MTISVLFDTSVVVDLQNLDPGRTAQADAMISSITVAELAYGLDVDDPLERRVRTERFATALELFPVLPFGRAEADMYGTMAALVRRAGRDPRPRRMDLLIAATAGVHSLPLLTRNGKDLKGLERVIDVITV